MVSGKLLIDCCAISEDNFLSGFKWQQQLVFRSKLTMHTAYDRKDNTEPASITSLAVSKDHRTLYVGELSVRFIMMTFTDYLDAHR